MTDMPELENLDDVSFTELMKISVSEIPDLCPEWTDFNAHDPGITFLEMLMWLTEMQRYYLFQITEDHLKSYLRLIGRLIGSEAKAAEPAVIAARISSEKTIPLKKGTVFHIGDIPYQTDEDTVIVPEKPEVFYGESGGIIVKQDFSPFKGGIFTLYFSLDKPTVNPMREGFYPRAEIKVRIITNSGDIECPARDGTYGLYQSGFISVSMPGDLDGGASVLRLDIISDDYPDLPPIGCFNSDIRKLVQRGEKGDTLGADGTVKENVPFSAEIGGQSLEAVVFKEIRSGKNAETPEDAFKRFKAEQRRFPRAVRGEDYARLVMETPGLRAQIVNVFSKETGKVLVCVKTDGGALRKNEIKNLRKVLFEAKPVGMEIEILSPVIFSARLFITVKTDGRTGVSGLSEHIRNVFRGLEKCMGARIVMPELIKKILEFPSVSEIKSVLLRLGKGLELSENDTVKLPEDGLLSLDEIIIQ